jgi:hypothetical protein
MKKVAKLVLWSPMTRVVVNEDTSYEEIIEAAKSKFKVILENDYTENIEDVIDDLECPAKDEEVLDNLPTSFVLTRDDLKDEYADIDINSIGWREFKKSVLSFTQYDRAKFILFVDNDATSRVLKGSV